MKLGLGPERDEAETDGRQQSELRADSAFDQLGFCSCDGLLLSSH